LLPEFRVKVSGCSGKLLTVSRSIFAGTAADISSEESTETSVVIVVSRSEAVIVNFPGLK
jgi:hypothetical protein